MINKALGALNTAIIASNPYMELIKKQGNAHGINPSMPSLPSLNISGSMLQSIKSKFGDIRARMAANSAGGGMDDIGPAAGGSDNSGSGSGGNGGFGNTNRIEKILSDTHISIKSIQDILSKQLNINEEMKKKLEEIANFSNKNKTASMSDPVVKNLTHISGILERIARATEDSAKIAKLSVGLGATSDVKASAVTSSLRSLDPTNPGGMSKGSWFQQSLKIQQATLKASEETVKLLHYMVGGGHDDGQDIGGGGWKQGLFNMIKRGGLSALLFGGAAAIGGAKLLGKHVVMPHIEDTAASIRSSYMARRERQEASALKEYYAAMKSGDPKKIEAVKIKLKRSGLDKLINMFSGAGGIADPQQQQAIMSRIRGRGEAATFDNETRESIVKGIPFLLSEIIKAINGNDVKWDYIADRLNSTEQWAKSQKSAYTLDASDAQAELAEKGLFLPKKGRYGKRLKAESTMTALNNSETTIGNTTGKIDSTSGLVNNINNMQVARNFGDLNEVTKAGAGSVAGDIAWAGTKAVAKFAAYHAFRATIMATLEALHNTEFGREFFKKVVKPTLDMNGITDVKDLHDLAIHIDVYMPYFVASIKETMEAIKKGDTSILAPVGSALRFIFKMDKDGKPSPATKKLLDFLDAAEEFFLGTGFAAVAQAVKWIKSNYMSILKGENEAYNGAASKIDKALKYPFKEQVVEEFSLDDFYHKVAAGDNAKFTALLSRAGFSDEDIQKEIAKFNKTSNKTNSKSLFSALSGKTINTASNNVNNITNNRVTKIDFNPLIELLSIEGNKTRETISLGNQYLEIIANGNAGSSMEHDILISVNKIVEKMDNISFNSKTSVTVTMAENHWDLNTASIVAALKKYFGESFSLFGMNGKGLGSGISGLFGGAMSGTGAAMSGIGYILKAIGAGIYGIFKGGLVVGGMLKYLAKPIGLLLEGLGTGIAKALMKTPGLIKSLGKGIVKIFENVIYKPLAFVGKRLLDAAGYIGHAVKAIGKVAKGAYNIGSKLGGMLKGFVNTILSPFQWIMDKVGAVFGWIKGAAIKGAKYVGTKVSNFFGFGKDAETKSNNRYLRLIVAYTRGTYENLSVYLRSLGLTPARIKMPAKTAFGQTVNNMASMAKGIVTNTTDFFKKSVGAISNKLKEKREKRDSKNLDIIAKNVKSLHKEFSGYSKWQRFKSFLGGIFNVLKSGLGMLTSMIGGAFSSLFNFLGIGKAARWLGSLASGAMTALTGGGAVAAAGAGAAGAGGAAAAAGAAGAGAAGASRMSKLATGALKVGKQALKAVPGLGIAVMAADALYGGFKGWNNAGNIHGLKEGQQASTSEKTSAALGGAVGSLAGIVDLIPGSGLLANALGFESIEDMVTKGTAKVAKTGINFVQGGISVLGGLITGNTKTNAIVASLTNSGIIESNLSKIERINDYGKFKSLPANQIQAMIDYGFSNPKDADFAYALLNEKNARTDNTSNAASATANSNNNINNALDNAEKTLRSGGGEIKATISPNTELRGVVRISEAPNVFTDMRTLLSKIEVNTRINKGAFNSSGSNNSTNGEDNRMDNSRDVGSSGSPQASQSGNNKQYSESQIANSKAMQNMANVNERSTSNPLQFAQTTITASRT